MKLNWKMIEKWKKNRREWKPINCGISGVREKAKKRPETSESPQQWKNRTDRLCYLLSFSFFPIPSPLFLSFSLLFPLSIPRTSWTVQKQSPSCVRAQEIGKRGGARAREHIKWREREEKKKREKSRVNEMNMWMDEVKPHSEVKIRITKMGGIVKGRKKVIKESQ